MDLKKLLDKRLDRITLMVQATAIKIVRKELKNFKREVIKAMLKNGRRRASA